MASTPASPQDKTNGPLNAGRFLRFLLVGGVATAVQYLVAALLYGVWGWAPVWASSLGFVLGALANYALNARFTFGVRGDHGRHLPRFAAVASLGWTLNALGMWALPRLGLHPYIAQPLVTVAVLFVNFALNALWAMRPHPPRSKGAP